MANPLAPISSQFLTTEPTCIVLKEKKGVIGSDDAATIKDKDGNLLFQISKSLVSLSERRTLKDANGNAVGQLRLKKTPGFHTTWYIGTTSNDKAAALKKKGITNITKCDAEIIVDGKEVGEASGNWRAKKFEITIGGNKVAEIGRQSSLTTNALLFDADSYCIDVLVPGVDLAFMSLMCAGLDELYHDND